MCWVCRLNMFHSPYLFGVDLFFHQISPRSNMPHCLKTKMAQWLRELYATRTKRILQWCVLGQWQNGHCTNQFLKGWLTVYRKYTQRTKLLLWNEALARLSLDKLQSSQRSKVLPCLCCTDPELSQISHGLQCFMFEENHPKFCSLSFPGSAATPSIFLQTCRCARPRASKRASFGKEPSRTRTIPQSPQK